MPEADHQCGELHRLSLSGLSHELSSPALLPESLGQLRRRWPRLPRQLTAVSTIDP